MYKLALSLIGKALGKLGGPSVMGVVLACVLPLLLLLHSRMGLADLRQEHSALQAEYAALRNNLARCREAASLHDLVLMAREREMQQINNKYSQLREDFLRKILPEQENDQTPEAETYYSNWCAQPVPLSVRELFSAATGPAATPLPSAPGRTPYGNSPAGSPLP